VRSTFLDALFDEMKKDESIFFLTADMGINLVERFEEAYPTRFINIGIAEQNLIGVAAGLAESGYKPFVYTISNFLIHRCLEQIRNDLLLHDLNVTLIGTSTGFDNAPLGPTHHIIDDWGVVNALSGMKIYCPSSKATSLTIFDLCISEAGTKYVRIPKGAGLNDDFSSSITGEVDIVISYGSALDYAQEFTRKHAFEFLPIWNLSTMNYPELEIIKAKRVRIHVIEDHFGHSGLYSIMCRWANENQFVGKILSVAPIEYQLRVRNSFLEFIEDSGMKSDL
jgi:transketolase